MSERHCEPCEGGSDPLSTDVVVDLIKKIPEWEVQGGSQISRTFVFEDFKSALDFVNEVGSVAEEEGHHPDIFLTWGEVGITLSTHAIGGLSKNDFILAAKIDTLL